MNSRFHSFVLLAVLLAVSGSAHAYVDPGAGSLLLQLIIGGVGGALVALKLFWGRLKSRSRSQEQQPK